MNVCGESGGDVEFSDYIQKNFDLYFYRNGNSGSVRAVVLLRCLLLLLGYYMSPHAVASFARTALAEAIRSRVHGLMSTRVVLF